MLTTLLSSFYPLYSLAGKKWGIAGKIALFAVTEGCSFIGFKSIVANVYPALGIFGIAITIFAAGVYLKRTGFKKRVGELLPHGKEQGNKTRRVGLGGKTAGAKIGERGKTGGI